jgi:GDP-L-fucose synthase
MDHFESSELINLGTGLDISIKDLAHLIAQEVGFEGEIVWDSSMPNGMLKKCMDINKLKALGFEAEIDLQSGIQQSIQEYRCLSSFH